MCTPSMTRMVIAGQGTIGLEILASLPELTTLVVPIGGGGLISGIAIAVKALKPRSEASSACKALAAHRCKPSLAAGHAVTATAASTIADGIAVKRPGEITLRYIRELVDDVVEVDEDEIARGIAHCAHYARLVVEGAGAAGVAALLAGRCALKHDELPAPSLCGGNIDANMLARVIEQVMVQQGRIIVLKLTVVDRPGQLANLVNHVAAVWRKHHRCHSSPRSVACAARRAPASNWFSKCATRRMDRT